ncbi:hypothetical protein BJ741DRAFT_647026 [Chytriomyces cf. hyalinus JEL632]|nr:hypothetical protein BJ741DRAFT_647026 [Chytriomyces cf. hyalinus JEL632]
MSLAHLPSPTSTHVPSTASYGHWMRSCEAYCQDPNKALFTQSWDFKRSTTITHHHMTPSPSCHKVSDSITLENTNSTKPNYLQRQAFGRNTPVHSLCS